MAVNTIANLIPDVYSAMDIVSRECVGYIPAVTRDPTVERAAVGQLTRAFSTRAAVATNITPGVIPPDDGEQVFDNFQMTITKARRVPFRWNGEQAKGLNNGGPGVRALQVDQISQAIRALTNEMEADVAALAAYASRAVGTPTTLPFASTASAGTDSAAARKVLVDNGCPMSDLQMVISTGGGANLRSHAQLQKINETGAVDFLRQGTLIDMNSFAIRESAAVVRPAIGTSNNAAATDAAGYAIGATVITTTATGTGSILAGDVVTFAGDLNKYIVAPGGGVASNAAGGTLTIAKPGLRQAIVGAKVITTVAISTRNTFFRRSALVLACRLPALVDGEDMAVERSLVQDPISGIAYEIAKYQQYRQTQWEISAAWGVGCPKPEHVGVLLGE
jgi:hypothetical protein